MYDIPSHTKQYTAHIYILLYTVPHFPDTHIRTYAYNYSVIKLCHSPPKPVLGGTVPSTGITVKLKEPERCMGKREHIRMHAYGKAYACLTRGLHRIAIANLSSHLPIIVNTSIHAHLGTGLVGLPNKSSGLK